VAVVAAGAATVILRPRSGLVDPAAIDLRAYFSEAEVRRAEDFRGLQRLIGVGSLLVSGATLAVLALRPPAAVRRGLERAGEKPVRGGALVGAGISLSLTVTGIPLSVWAHERAVDYGLSTQSLGPWFADVGRSAAIGAVTAAIGGAVAIALIRRFPTRWWIPAGGVVTGFAVLVLYLSPVVIDPFSTASIRCRRESCARMSSGWPTGRMSTWARSTVWTPAAVPRPSTPTWAAWATPSGSCSTTT